MQNPPPDRSRRQVEGRWVDRVPEGGWVGRCLLESLELQELQPAPETPSLAPINTTAKRNHAWQEPGYLATPGAEPGEGREPGKDRAPTKIGLSVHGINPVPLGLPHPCSRGTALANGGHGSSAPWTPPVGRYPRAPLCLMTLPPPPPLPACMPPSWLRCPLSVGGGQTMRQSARGKPHTP